MACKLGLKWLGPTRYLLTLIPLILHVLTPALCQNPYPVGPADARDENNVANTFYLTSRSDCSDDLKDIYNNEGIIRGYDLKNMGTGPKTCTLRITSSSTYTGVTLQIQIIAMNILDCRTQLSIYDGQADSKLGSFDCRSSQNRNRGYLSTSGDVVTFMFSRNDADNHQFDIEVRVKALRGGLNPNDRRTNFFSFQKFEQSAIVGMIGGFYALVVIICVSVVLYCNYRYRGLDKKWETLQLSTMKTDTNFGSRSQVSQPPWSVGTASQRGPISQYSRSYTEPYSRKGAPTRSEDGSSVDYDHDVKLNQRNLMNDDRDRNRGRDRMASHNGNYDDDDDDPDNFREKVITSRVKTGNGARWKPKGRGVGDRRPPSFEEATRDDSSERSSDEEEEETDESSEGDSTRKRLTTSSEGDSETETESESEESDASSRAGGARARRSKNHKSKGKDKPRRRRQSSSDETSSRRTDPSSKPPKYPPPPHGAIPYGAYPPPGGQFVPIMAGPQAQFQPMPMVPPNYPPPQYPTEANLPPPTHGQVQPTDPPVYSYLVRRGYTPLDEQNRRVSPAPAASANSSQRSGPVHRGDSETPLQSGVEYMRR